MDNPVVTDWLTQPDGLAARLRQARLEAALTTRGLAKAVGWSHAKVSRIENGRHVPAAKDIESWARLCGLSRATTKQLLADLHEAKSLHLQARQRIRQQAEHQANYNDLTAATTTTAMFETNVIPGLLQTADYAAAILTLWARQFGRDLGDVREAAKVRLRRSEMLYDDDKTFTFVLTQDVLRWQYCEPSQMRAQLNRVAMLAELPSVDFRIIPTGRMAQVAVAQSFGVYDEMVIFETWTGEVIHTEAAIVEQYKQMVGLLSDAAVGGAEAVQLVLMAAEGVAVT